MYFLFFLPILCVIKDFTNIDNLNNILKPFLCIKDSITSIEDDLYIFFNMDTAIIKLTSEVDINILEIKFNNKRNNILPECLGRLINIRIFILTGNSLTALPQYFAKFTLLYSLNLSSNNLTKLPEILYSLKNLTYLYLNDNFIECIDDNIEALEHLDTLELSINNIQYLSENLNKLKSLSYLNLNSNIDIIRTHHNDMDIKKDEDFWKKIPSSVECLCLNSIRLRYISDSIILSKLYTLTLRNNFLKNLPWSLSEFLCNSTLDLSFNHFTDIPHCIYHLKGLEFLKLNNNKLKGSFYLEKNMLTELKELDLDYTNITNFEIEGYNTMCISTGKYIQYNNHRINNSQSSNDTLGKKNSKAGIIYSLQILSITISNIFIVPNLLIFPNLLDLKITNKDTSDIGSKIVKSLFRDLGTMKFLTNLQLTGFNFVTIPHEIFTLQNLKYLSLSYCKIKKISDKIVGLSNLEGICLYNNNIEKINPTFFKFRKPIQIELSKNPFTYFPSEITNNNLNFKLFVYGTNLRKFKQDKDNLGIMDIPYKKAFKINGYDFFNNSSMSIEELYNKAHNEKYKWELNQMLKIKNRKIKESKNDYNAIIKYWDILEKHIPYNNIKEKFLNYLQVIYGINGRGEEYTSNLIKTIKSNIKNYLEAIFEILTNLVAKGNTGIVEIIILTIEPGLSVCLDGQLQHFSCGYHLLIGDYNESTTITYFIKNKISLLKYDALREITTSNTEDQNVHTFSYWQRELYEPLGLPFEEKQYGLSTQSILLQSKEYILYQFFKLMSVKNVVKDLYESINKTNERITMAFQYISNKKEKNNIKEYVEYKGNIEYLQITSITKNGVYFILEEMGLIKKVKKK